nr:hypothetical protein CFP56_10771 [Quercus suber]
MEALRQAGVEASSVLWKDESVYYPSAIREATPDGPEAEEAAVETAATPGGGVSDAGATGEPVQGSRPPLVVEVSDDSNEARPSPDAQVSSAEGVAIPVAPLQAIPLSQGSEDPEAALVRPPTRAGN